MRTLAISAGLVAALVVLFAVVVFAIAFFVISLRSYQRQQDAVAASRARAAGLPAPPSRAPAVSRRDFFRKSLITSLLVFGAQFGGASIAFLWPNLKGGFGALIDAGDLADIKAAVATGAKRWPAAVKASLRVERWKRATPSWSSSART